MVFPETYPGSSPPVVEMESMVLDRSMMDMMVRKLEDEMFVPGEEVCFEWLSWVNEEFEQCTAAAAHTGGGAASQGDVETCLQHGVDESIEFPQISVHDGEYTRVSWDIFHGEVLEQKKSTFQGHVARVSCLEDVEQVMECLLQNNKIQHATHNIMAYRFYMEKNGIRTLLQDCDDDGEAAAGKRLLHLLQVMDVQGLVVVVSRWYGGIHLGPARFQCINNAGRTAIEGFLKEEGDGSGQTQGNDATLIKRKKNKKNVT